MQMPGLTNDQLDIAVITASDVVITCDLFRSGYCYHTSVYTVPLTLSSPCQQVDILHCPLTGTCIRYTIGQAHSLLITLLIVNVIT